MNNHILPKYIITLVTVLTVFCSLGSVSAQESSSASAQNGSKEVLNSQARQYREAGLEYQRKGNLAGAMSLYQKAIAIDPNYAMAYNDLGIVYEAAGFAERAEESYLRAIQIDPAYASTYTNLALFYESQRDLEKAAFYWSKRVELGSADDPWTKKAASRLKDIRLVLSNNPIANLREEQVLGLMNEVSVNKTVVTKDAKTIAQEHFRKAKLSADKGDLATAIKEALDAQYLDPKNKQIEEFIEKTENKALTR